MSLPTYLLPSLPLEQRVRWISQTIDGISIHYRSLAKALISQDTMQWDAFKASTGLSWAATHSCLCGWFLCPQNSRSRNWMYCHLLPCFPQIHHSTIIDPPLQLPSRFVPNQFLSHRLSSLFLSASLFLCTPFIHFSLKALVFHVVPSLTWPYLTP